MRFRELNIQTQRQAPSNARTEGFAFLARAGYVTRESAPTILGEQVLKRLEALSQKSESAFFDELALPVIRTASETFFSISTGDIEILHCSSCHYAERRGLARVRKQASPAEGALPLEKVATPDCHTIEALADYLHLSKEKTAKALMYTRTSDGKFVFVVVRGDMQLSQDKLRSQVGDARPATPQEISASGAEAGYASPIGLKDSLILADDLIPASANLVAGANEAGYHLKNTNYGRDYSAEIVADLTLANPGDACPNCGAHLELAEGNLLADGNGLYFEDVLSALAEVHHDDRGLAFPPPAAPFDVYLMHIPGKELNTRDAAEDLYAGLQDKGLLVLFDDRDERAGVKFNDADLVGLPVRVTAGEKNLKAGMVELKPRKDTDKQLVSTTDLARTIQILLKTHE